MERSRKKGRETYRETGKHKDRDERPRVFRNKPRVIHLSGGMAATGTLLRRSARDRLADARRHCQRAFVLIVIATAKITSSIKRSRLSTLATTTKELATASSRLSSSRGRVRRIVPFPSGDRHSVRRLSSPHTASGFTTTVAPIPSEHHEDTRDCTQRENDWIALGVDPRELRPSLTLVTGRIILSVSVAFAFYLQLVFKAKAFDGGLTRG